MSPQVASTNDVYQAIVGRILNFVPSGANSEMPATSLMNGPIGKRLWIVQAPDGATFPYITLRLTSRQGVLGADSMLETFELEVKCWNRPRTTAAQEALQSIADQVEAALTDWIEPTAPIQIRGKTLRDTIYYATAPADRDVVLELLRFAGWMGTYYLGTEVGTS